MGRWLARILAVLVVGVGAGLVAWAIGSTALHEPVRPLFGLERFFAQASEIIGWGAGFLAVGFTTLVLTYLEREPANDDLWDE